MRRRDFIKGIVGIPSAWPFTARAQQPERVKRIGVLSNAPADAQGQSGIEAFQQALRQLGWSEGSNVQIDVRWGENDPDRARKYAAELVALAPDVLLAAGTLGVMALQKATRAVPIVFVASLIQSVAA
jgi:putative ABC transport system substrate-binding protein